MFVYTIDGSKVCVCEVGCDRETNELSRYRATGYSPEDIYDLEEKYWIANMQIALYDNELRELKNSLA